MLQERQAEDLDIFEAMLADGKQLPMQALERLQRSYFRHDPVSAEEFSASSWRLWFRLLSQEAGLPNARNSGAVNKRRKYAGCVPV